MEYTELIIHQLSALQIDELRVAFRYSRPHCPRGIAIHKIGFDNRGGLILEIEDHGRFDTVRIDKTDQESKIEHLIFGRENH